MKKVLRIFGVNLTKGGLAKGIGKFIPILGGIIAGGLTFATMKPMGESLQKELSKLVNYSEVQYQEDVETIRKEAEIIKGE
ncbi:ABC transporter ATPase [Streptococcus pneumoniae]|nr:ABC transporter ATPase [Streptococcus pneumoniae]